MWKNIFKNLPVLHKISIFVQNYENFPNQSNKMAYQFMSAADAAAMINNGDTIGLSGFTAPGVPKSILEEVAHRAAAEHEKGNEFKINIFSGASTNDHVDGILARNNAVNMRAPYQNTPDLRKRINAAIVRASAQ